MRVQEAHERMVTFQTLLLEDIRAARNFALNKPTPYACRTLYRTTAAYIEGVVYQLRLVCLAALEDDPTIYSPSEILALKEKTVILKKKWRDSRKGLIPKASAKYIIFIQVFR
ncbi:hypothetical protein ACJJIX_00110 [Microbulbifer sp. VAAC004]|uniref:hypothetical protein n=1 Tax=unclassified Microbulbifer TaxID=2619833 RepID=UPI004039F7F3